MIKSKFERIGFAAILLVLVGILVMINIDKSSTSTTDVISEKVDTDLTKVEILQKFDLVGDGYHLLFEELALPNTLEQLSPPEITGNKAADDYIRKKAEARGYRLRRVAASESELTLVDGQLIQTMAALDWQKLQESATSDGITITIRSGYRSVDDQREVFIDRLATNGVTTSLITSGSQDVGIQETLRLVAPPGFSRHHNGYTIDLRSADHGTFLQSNGFSWMSKNNYENTLKYGFIPSYPEGAKDQGPDPESWEFVWVSRSLIESQIDS